jgi:hypothetical protein
MSQEMRVLDQQGQQPLGRVLVQLLLLEPQGQLAAPPSLHPRERETMPQLQTNPEHFPQRSL